MTKIKTLRVDGRVDGWTGGITLRGPRGPKKILRLEIDVSIPAILDVSFPKIVHLEYEAVCAC